ncbi:hypothetical protein PVAND_001890 [Polypedilum vanderplanki]|uniref:Golgi to ER traffic protein 4-like protein n=1 Tax=Polypedilum vanderplanki TaxID=319348 RepID=A0A9J6BQP7_POLVA|nr:hypothetical protein PVAND_001890 [Polypedilum vanderplanki]
MANRGVEKLIDKIKQSMSEKRYYESHQLWRTIYFRLLKQERYFELAEILYDGALQLINVKQFQSGSDLALLLIEVLTKCTFNNNTKQFEKWIENVGSIIGKIDSSVVEREMLIVKAIKWSSQESNSKNPLMHKLIAKIMANEQNYEQARHHSLLAKNGIFCAKILIQLSNKALNSEVDMIIVQVVLNLLILKDERTAMTAFHFYVKHHPLIRTSELPFCSPLLNFAYFLLNIIDEKNLQAFTTLCDLYRTALNRDPEYEKKLEKIGILFFNAPVKQENRGGGLFGDLFNQLFQELENDSDSDNNENSMQSTSSNYLSSNVDLD